uniref:Phospholipase A2 n=1 Tax=Panagrolaimus sp. ES5 TaxID=591445 RepID=A0AC34FUN3_9BILA
MNNLFGLVKKASEFAPTAVQLYQSAQFNFQKKSSDGTHTLIVDAVYTELKKVSENKFKYFNIYKSNDGSFKIVFEMARKQVYSTADEKEAYFVAQRLENLKEIGEEIVKSSLNLNKFIEIALEHQNWTDFQCACALGCIGYVSKMLQKEQNQNDHLMSVTADTGELPFHLAITNKQMDVANLLFGRAVDKEVIESVKILATKLDEKGFRRMMTSGFQPLHKPIQNALKKEVADIIITKNCKFIEIKNEINETPLFACIRNGDLAMVLHLIALGANTEEKDADGRNVLEAAFAHEKIIFVKLFHSLGFSIDKDALKSKCKVPASMWSELDRILKELQTKNNPVIVSPIMEQMQNILVEEVLKPTSPKGLRVLSLDGGGIRGIMSVIILKELENRLQQKLGNSEVLIAQFFNFIGGTSTGAIIALALAKGKSAFEILKLYIRFRDKVFFGKRPYDSGRLEEFLKQELGETTTLEQISKFTGLKVMVTTTKADIMPPQLVLLRNYD